ncbi:putative DMT superfamily transporter inner membrane protein [Actinomadura rubteroloni]|uniref:Putative DMT superfamily transporter inner membrane protein n=1 Tax=Actinomadura rubteroloni TaxID=1926885 RepID=A0A2P4UGD4_9ACTN|nr:EamA family transporter [Actinomadura rubteroloni]POM24122.1 putative DMT superfamily transporter inner membrane protein [Actinomadura rubteroloni]
MSQSTSALPRGTAEILLAACLWGTAGPVSTLAPAATSPVAVSSLRVALGGLVLLAVAATGSRRAALGALLRRGGRTRATLVLGVLCTAGYQTAYYTAVGRTGVAVATVVAVGSAPAFAGLFQRHGLTGRWYASTAGAVAGCALLVGAGAGAGAEPGGVALALLCGLVYAGYTTIISRLVGAGADGRSVTGVLFGGAALVLLPALAVQRPAWLLSGTGLAITAYLSLITIAVAYTLFARGLRGTPAAAATTLTLAEPAVAALLGVAVLGERLGGLALAGLALLAAGLVVLVVPVRRRRDDGRIRPELV